MLFLISFFSRNMFRSRRVVLTATLGLVPVLLAAMLLLMPYLTGVDIDPSGLFIQMGQLMYLYILLPLVAALIGSGVVADEVEDRTLPYIITRPVPKWRFIFSKVISAFLVTAMILIVSLCMTYGVLNGLSGNLLTGSILLLRVALVLLLGSLAYVSLFGLLGAAARRPVLYGLVFAFGWEKIVAHLPMRIKYLTIVKYLNDLYPYHAGGRSGIEGMLDDTVRQLLHGQSGSMALSTLSLLLIALCCTGLITLLLYIKEYRLEQD